MKKIIMSLIIVLAACEGGAENKKSVCDEITVEFECTNEMIVAGADCTDENLMGNTCESLGYSGGLLGCCSNCKFDTDGCH